MDLISISLDGDNDFLDFVQVDNQGKLLIDANEAKGPGLYFGQVVVSDETDSSYYVLTVFVEEKADDEGSEQEEGDGKGDTEKEDKTEEEGQDAVEEPTAVIEVGQGISCDISECDIDWDQAQ